MSLLGDRNNVTVREFLDDYVERRREYVSPRIRIQTTSALIGVYMRFSARGLMSLFI